MRKVFNRVIQIFRKKYFFITFIFVSLIVGIGTSYSFWSFQSGWQLASEIKFKNLYYSLDTTTFQATANTVTYKYINITTLNEINSKYLLSYKSNVSNVEVKVSSLSANDSSGIIGVYNKDAPVKKKLRLAIINNSASLATIELSVTGGYGWNTSSTIEVEDTFTPISGVYQENNFELGLTLSERISELLNCNFTSDSVCFVTHNSASNYVSFNSKIWRIMGVYKINNVYYTKLVLEELLPTPVTYTNTSSALTTFYNTLNTSYIQTGMPFSCTATACTTAISGNIGLLTLNEFSTIGANNSYLYTKPEYSYWTSSTSGSNYYVITSKNYYPIVATNVAYVKPTIYLKSNVVANPGTEGTIDNPYTISLGYPLTVTDNYGTTELRTGTYAVGKAYNVPKATRNGDYIYLTPTVTGTGTTYVTNGETSTLTMGAASSAITFNWKAEPSFTINDINKTFAAREESYLYQPLISGNYIIELWGAQGPTNTSSNNDYTGGLGSYTKGVINLSRTDNLYFSVGTQGIALANIVHASQTEVKYGEDTLAARIMVAASGSSGSFAFIGRAGGGISGYLGSSVLTWFTGNDPGFGTQTAGGVGPDPGRARCPGGNSGRLAASNGTFGLGGAGYYLGMNAFIAGHGGSGYYGGGGSLGYDCGSVIYSNVPGSGSSFISGHLGCVAIAGASNITARTGTNGATCVGGGTDPLCDKHYSNKYFVDTLMIDGKGLRWTNTVASDASNDYLMPDPDGGFYALNTGHSGDGVAKISFAGDISDLEYVMVDINMNGGTQTGIPVGKAQYLQYSYIPLGIPTKTGATFREWTVTGTGASISNGDLLLGSGAATLTANWN